MTKRNFENISVVVNQLGLKVMASECVVTDEYAVQMVSSLDRAIAKYIYDTETFLCRPWPEGLEPGRVLVAAIMERPMRDLLDLLEQLRFAIRDPEQAVAKYGGTKINLSMNLNIDLESQAFQVWAENTGQWIALQESLLADESFYERPARTNSFSSILAGFFLGGWLSGN